MFGSKLAARALELAGAVPWLDVLLAGLALVLATLGARLEAVP